jgi:hypothetical protein
MDFHDIYIVFKEPLCTFPKDLIFFVIEMTYEKCCECGKYLVNDEYKCNMCYTYYCKFHYYILTDSCCCINCTSGSKIIIFNDTVRFMCIKCTSSAYYGYRDIIIYCRYHALGKKVIDYNKYCDYDSNNNDCFFKGIYSDKNTSDLFCRKHKTSNKLNYKKIIY